jgi:hypothetical protein
VKVEVGASACALFVLDLRSVGFSFAALAKTLSPDSGPGNRIVLCLQSRVVFPSWTSARFLPLNKEALESSSPP